MVRGAAGAGEPLSPLPRRTAGFITLGVVAPAAVLGGAWVVVEGVAPPSPSELRERAAEHLQAAREGEDESRLDEAFELSRRGPEQGDAAAQARDLLEQLMTPEQVVRARRRSRELIERLEAQGEDGG